MGVGGGRSACLHKQKKEKEIKVSKHPAVYFSFPTTDGSKRLFPKFKTFSEKDSLFHNMQLTAIYTRPTSASQYLKEPDRTRATQPSPFINAFSPALLYRTKREKKKRTRTKECPLSAAFNSRKLMTETRSLHKTSSREEIRKT